MELISSVKFQKVSSPRCLEKCVNLAAKIFSETSGIDFLILLDEYKQWFDLKDNIFIIAKSSSDEIIGFLRLIPKKISLSIGLINTARFENVFIVPSYRGKNISRRLIDYAIKVSIENNMSLAYVIARRGVDHFYPKFGFHGVSCYPKVKVKLSELHRIKIENVNNISIGKVKLEDLYYISKLYSSHYKSYFGSSIRNSNNWERVLSNCKKENIKIYKVMNNKSICAYCIFKGNKILEIFYDDFNSIIYFLLQVMNEYDEIVFNQTIDHEFFKSLNNIDLNFGIRSCPYGGHMIAILDIKLITKNFHQKFKDYLIKKNIRSFAANSNNINLEYEKGNLKIKIPDNLRTADFKSNDIKLLLGIKSIYSNPLNDFSNYFYFPDLDQIM